RIRKIEIQTKGVVQELFSGEYHSSFKGQGLEFAEVREYQPGDSYKSIDWNVSARFGVPYIKKYQETRELNVFFIIDSSASLDFGTRVALKRERLAEIVAVLSFSALSNNDKVGLIMYSDRLEKYLPPKKGRNSALKILREILYHESVSHRTDLSGAFEYAGRMLRKRSIVFVLSDFFDLHYEKELKILAKKHDVIALQILDQADLELPQAGILELRDPETGVSFTVNSSSPLIRKNYSLRVEAEQKKLLQSLKTMNVDHVRISSTDDYVQALRQLFAKRSHLKGARR
ncbi:MAG TPA: DUF58 domain-containing protein, partial [Candidatus Cloacimonadota bacterium]|nr:DUF58 domain-containing protein [Candidatus Cloacimonadota bacterium]